MLKDLFPEAYGRYLSLPTLGSVVDEFANWLADQGYRQNTRAHHVGAFISIERYLRRRRLQHLRAITASDLEACWGWYHRRDHNVSTAVHVLKRFLETRGLLAPSFPQSPTRVDASVSAYADYLRTLRGFGHSAVHNHALTATLFLEHLEYETVPSRLSRLGTTDIESFLRSSGERLSRGSMQHTVAELRSFLRFLASEGLVRQGLDQQIDTPRVYRLEQLPRALPWDKVAALLESVDRTTPLGLRNHAMFFLMATYGLRRGEISSLTLDDINWRARSIRIAPHKNGCQLVLPLTDDAGAVLLEYLRRGRPASPLRHLFLQMRAPAGVLSASTVTEAFRIAVKKSGLKIPVQGPHCLRHSYAVHLLRQGTPLKTIGDLLGHRMADSTYVYLRLATEDLREVALSIPRRTGDGKEALR